MFGRPRARERARRRAPLDVEQLAERVAAEVGELGDVGVQRRDRTVGRRGPATATKVTVLSGGPSMNSCTCVCWSVAPSAGSGVGPTDAPSGVTLPSDSAHSCTNHAAMSRSASLYGMSTCTCGRAACRRATAARRTRRRGWPPSSSALQRARMSAAPASSAATSMPMSAAGSTPTGVSTLNRPPTLAGMSSAVMPSARAIGRSAPLTGIGDEDEVLRRAASPSAASSAARTMRYCAIVSAVPPDFDVTRNSVRCEVERRERREDRVGIDVVEHVQPRLAVAGGVAAARSTPAGAARCAARWARAPSRRCRAPRRRGTGRARRRRSRRSAAAAPHPPAGRGSRASPRACLPMTAACAPRNLPAASLHSASVTMPGRNMFVKSSESVMSNAPLSAQRSALHVRSDER